MHNIDTIFLFIFVFSILNVVRIVFLFIRSLLQETPQQVILSSRGILLLGLSLSYIITYIIKN
jgi:hypothetical protein